MGRALGLVIRSTLIASGSPCRFFLECGWASAFDYVIKPFSINQIDVILKKAESFSQLVKVNQFLNQESVNATELIGGGPAMEGLRRMILRVAPTEATVLVSGENGTGKELVANEIFRTSTLLRNLSSGSIAPGSASPSSSGVLR